MALTKNSGNILLIAMLAFCGGSASAQNIDISFTGIKSADGQIIVKVFADEDGFRNDKAVKSLKFKKSELAHGHMTGKTSLEPGVYGFALLDDENGNGVMDYNFVKMPKEGFGFSNFYLSGLKKPKFEEFKFTVSKNQQVKVNMKLRYL